MKRFGAVVASLGLALFALPVTAQPWEFAPALTVAARQAGVFHHLESAGRHNIAVSAGTVAVAWEDNRDGVPRVYLARKGEKANAFAASMQISGEGEAYEPSLLALDQQRFVLAWEEKAKIHVRLVTPTALGPTLVVGDDDATQPSLARAGEQLLLVYAQREGRFAAIRLQTIKLDGQRLLAERACPVDPEPVKDDQLYPSAVSVGKETIVAWEDRRLGHTIIMAAKAAQGSCQFTLPQRISEGRAQRSLAYGKGHGVSRVAIARYAQKQAFAVWADKRDFREGYDIYGADYEPQNATLFGANQRVQDSFGGVAQQWHATVAGDAAGQLVVAWDDNRDGDANILFSWREATEWSDDLVVKGAGGEGQQTHPSICLDAAGNLHVAWVDRKSVGGTTMLRYAFGRATGTTTNN